MKATYMEGTKTVQKEILDIEGNQLDPQEYRDVTVGNGTGPVTGFNRSPVEGESYIEVDVTKDMTKGYGYDKWECYQVVNGKLTLKAQEVLDSIENEKALKDYKSIREAEIRATYTIDSETPIEISIDEGTFTFNGGQDSAAYISGAISLADGLMEDTIGITDVNNVQRNVSRMSANMIAIAIGKSYRTAFFAKQRALVELKGEVNE